MSSYLGALKGRELRAECGAFTILSLLTTDGEGGTLGVGRINKTLEVMMAKCPQCKEMVTLERTRKEVANASDDVHKDVVGLLKKEVMYSCPHCDVVLGFGFYLGGLLTGRP
jgi:hypothetical protein